MILVFKKGRRPWNKDNPEASKRMMGAGNPMYGKPSPMKGKHRTFTEEHKHNISKGKTGVKLSKEHSRKIALGNTGKKRTPEVKKKMSEGKMGENNPFYGKKHKPESKKKISEQTTGEQNPFFGKKHTEEFKRGLSEARTGKTLGKDNPFFGKSHTEESIEMMRDASFLRKDGPWKDTWGEKELQSILTANEIQFVDQKYFHLARHRVDIFIEPNICIEVDGDYTHANPHPHLRPHTKSSIHPGHKPDEILRGGKTAKEKWEKDRRQTEALEQQCKQVVIRFYQSELEQNPEKCLQKIIKIIKKSKPKI